MLPVIPHPSFCNKLQKSTFPSGKAYKKALPLKKGALFYHAPRSSLGLKRKVIPQAAPTPTKV